MSTATIDFPAEAYQSLVEEVHKPVFLQKLARDWNIHPANEVEEQQLLEMAGMIRRAEDEEGIKQASAGNTLISEASDQLKSAMAKRGYPQQPTTRDRLIQKTANEAVNTRPDLVDAAVRFAQYLNQIQNVA